VAHNHPSGDPNPSDADVRLTRRLKEGAAILRVEFFDHVIIGLPNPDRPQPYFSFRESGHHLTPMIHPSALIDPTATIDSSVVIGPYVVI
jgi:hypothetical protein